MKSQRGKASTKASKQVTVTKTITNGNRRASRRNILNRIRSVIPSTLRSVAQSIPPALRWVRTLNNPFIHPGVKLGFGSFGPSTLCTSTFRLTTAANADGSFGVFALPSVGFTNPSIATCNAGSNTATWVGRTFSNAAMIGAGFGSARPLSLGVRVTPVVAMTVAPAVCYVGAIPASSYAALTSLTVNGLSQSPDLLPCVGSCAMVALGRPLDINVADYLVSTIYHASTATAFDFSIPTVVIAGLPASANLNVEVTFNYEAIRTSNNTTTWMVNNVDDDYEPNGFNSMESLFRWVSPKLLPTSNMLINNAQLEEISESTIRGQLSGSARRGRQTTNMQM